MHIYDKFKMEVKTEEYVTKDSSWSDISHYLMFLTLRNGGCSKSSSGSLRLLFPTHWDDVDMPISAEIGGYDMPNMSRHEEFSAKNEELLKEAIITKLVEARQMILDGKKHDDEDTL